MNGLAIIYICSGGYKVFWHNFYLSAEKYFAPNMKKTYFVFTDSDDIIQSKERNVKTYFTRKMGWPYDTLERWSDICRIQDILKQYDYIAFCNANTEFISTFDVEKYIGTESLLLWSITEKGTKSDSMPLERNLNSRAAIPPDADIVCYYNGGFILGLSDQFVKMSIELRDWTEEDLQNGIIARCHDESMLNSYIYHHPDVRVARVGKEGFMPSEFADEYNMPCAVFRNKDDYGGNIGIRYNNRILGNLDIFRRRVIGKIRSVVKR